MAFSLALLQQDPDFAALFKQKTETVKKDKTNLLTAARDFNREHEREIEEGTKKRALLLEEGKRKGLSEEETFQGNSLFIPTKQTPILNFLYFMMRAEKDREESNKRGQILGQKLMMLYEQLASKEGHEAAERKIQHILESEEHFASVTPEDHSVQARHVGENEKEFQDVVGFLYGNVTQDTFVKIKKLKALSQSKNEAEAFSAYRKCVEMCKQHGLEFDKIPSA